MAFGEEKGAKWLNLRLLSVEYGKQSPGEYRVACPQRNLID
jgi:hypothetical protein